MKSTSCVSHDLARLKPCWRWCRMLLFSKWDMMELTTICSMSLLQMQVRDMGR